MYHPRILSKGNVDERSKFTDQEGQSPGSDLNTENLEYDARVVCLVNELARVRNYVCIKRDNAEWYAGEGRMFRFTWVYFLRFLQFLRFGGLPHSPMPISVSFNSITTA
jgi:hypothetical protein